jgi:hypothetical protein
MIHVQQALAADPAPAVSPLTHNFREWNAAWKRGEALGRRIEQELEFRTFPDILPSSRNLRAVSGKTGSGLNVCLYPNGADPMMEEPEFLNTGDDARTDQAVLIAHLNTRGEWMRPVQVLRVAECQWRW